MSFPTQPCHDCGAIIDLTDFQAWRTVVRDRQPVFGRIGEPGNQDFQGHTRGRTVTICAFCAEK